jgi:5-methylthioadenosine/S-adenosylhomocysteine deaminase
VQSVDLVIADIAWLITMDASRRVIRDATIVADAGRIVAVGKSADMAQRYSGRRRVDGRATVATPGFIDCHLHSSFQLSRGLADESNAQSFLFDRMYPYEAALESEDVRVSATLAAAELLRHGVTCFIDPGNYHPEACVEGVMATGIRAIVSRSSFDLTKSVLGILPERMIESTDVAMERAATVLARYARSGNPRLGASASFRGLNNASDALITGLKGLADTYGTLLQTHACFSYSTHDSSVARTGLAEIERLESLGVIDERMLIVHSGWLEPGEVAILARRKPSLVCAPSSSLHNGYGNFVHGKLPELMALGVNVAVGSDHASSGIVDMAQEIRLACCCYKETRINPRVMPPGDRARNGDRQRRQGRPDERPHRQHRSRQGGRHRAVRHQPAGMAAADQSGIEPRLQRHRRFRARRVRDGRTGGGRRPPHRGRRAKAVRRGAGGGRTVSQAPQIRNHGPVEMAGVVTGRPAPSFRGALLREPGIQAAVQPARSGFRVPACGRPRNDGAGERGDAR